MPHRTQGKTCATPTGGGWLYRGGRARSPLRAAACQWERPDLVMAPESQRPKRIGQLADFQSAIQQISNLRYVNGKREKSKMRAPTGGESYFARQSWPTG